MEKIQLDCDQYKLYSPDSLNYITDEMHQILLNSIEKYKNLFNINCCKKIQINYFDDLSKFRNFIYELRGENKSLPEYAHGTYDKGMINAFISNNIKIDTPLYKKKLYMASHELFHIMYMEYALKNDYSKRIVWYDEGMAQYMSGEKDYLLNLESFKEYYLKVKESTKIYPNLNELKHGNSFCNADYNGYDLSYLAIRYLSEILTEKEFKSLLGNYNQIKIYGKNILNDIFIYYDDIFMSKIK